jgi:hypothetical protein
VKRRGIALGEILGVFAIEFAGGRGKRAVQVFVQAAFRLAICYDDVDIEPRKL